MALAVIGALLAAAGAPASRARAEGDESPSGAAQTVDVTISSAFVRPGPVRVGDIVHLEVIVTFATDTLPNADLIHIFEDGSLQFLGVSQGFVQLACAVFHDTPDSARATILCPLGTLLGPTPLTFSFQAREPTVGTSGESRVGFDLDGPDRQPGILIGPAVATIAIIDAVTPEALPAMGDGPPSAAPRESEAVASQLALAASAAAIALVARCLLAGATPSRRRPAAR